MATGKQQSTFAAKEKQIDMCQKNAKFSTMTEQSNKPDATLKGRAKKRLRLCGS